MYSYAEIVEKRRIAREARLSGAELLDDDEAVRRDCNGIGAEYFPAALRWTVTALCPSLAICADIHDRRYSIGGDSDDRDAADEEFRVNGERMADYTYGRFNPLRYLVRGRARLMHAILAAGGSKAYNYHGK